MKKYIVWAVLVGIMAIGLFLRISNVLSHKLYPDVYQNLLVARNIREFHSVVGPLGEHGKVFPDFFMWTRPLYPLLINVGYMFHKNDTEVAQVISLIAGLLAIPVAYIFLLSVKRHCNPPNRRRGNPVGNKPPLNPLLSKEGNFGGERLRSLSRWISGSLQHSSLLAMTQVYGISAALLLALSFNHTVWGGYMLTESIGVLFLLLFLWRLFSFPGKSGETNMANSHDLLLGFLFALAILSRYEYAVLILPVSVFIFTTHSQPLQRLITMTAATVCTLSIVFSQLFPIRAAFIVAWNQLQDLFKVAGAISFIGVIMLVFYRFILYSYREAIMSRVYKTMALVIWIIALYIPLQIFFPSTFPIFSYHLTAVRNFFSTDVLMGISFLIGCTLMLQDEKYRRYVLFVAGSIAVLAPLYYRINPTMQRYWTHLIPFLLIPASYGMAQFVILAKVPLSGTKAGIYSYPSTRKNVGLNRFLIKSGMTLLIIILVVIQILFTYDGLKHWKNGEWFRTSYEEKAARKVGQRVRVKDTILIVSFPEPYFYFSRLSTQSIADTYPYVFIDDSLNDRTVLLVQDMGMHDIFPNFSRFVNDRLQKYKVHEFWVGEVYHFQQRSVKEKYPVVLYELKLGQLKSIIKQQQ